MEIEYLKENKEGLDLVTLKNPETGVYISVLPKLGAALNEFCVVKDDKLVNVIDGYSSHSDFIDNSTSTFKSAKLSPFPNRIEGGKYEYQSKEFKLPINFPNERNSIHGLIWDKEFNVVKADQEEDFFELKLEHSFDGLDEGFPFPFKITYSYLYNGFDKLSIKTKVENTGRNSFPLGDGFHPYYTLGGKVDDWMIDAPIHSEIEMKNLIPTGKFIVPRISFNQLSLQSINLDHCFSLKQKSNFANILLQNEQNEIGLRLFQELGEGKYNYVQIFTPPHRDSIAIEPMTCPPNAFNNKIGLIELDAGVSVSFKCGIKVELH